jgi:Protein of unknown function (DUF3618)
VSEATPAPASPGPGGSEQDARTPEEIEAHIERTRQHLATSIDAISDRVSPKNVAKRTTERARAQVVDEHGAPRTNRIAAMAAAVAAFTALIVWRRRR